MFQLSKISKLISSTKYFESYFNLKLGHFFGTPCMQLQLLSKLCSVMSFEQPSLVVQKNFKCSRILRGVIAVELEIVLVLGYFKSF